MLPRANRLTSSAEFRSTVRRGRRAGGQLLVVHLMKAPQADDESAPRAGFTVARSVGAAVTRNRVKRRLRHLLRERLAVLPAGATLVIRALPASATASSAELGSELDRLVPRALGER